jgi:hypothetical protein
VLSEKDGISVPSRMEFEMSPEFRLVLFFAVGLTFACGATAVVLIVWVNPLTAIQQELSDTLLLIFKLGTGAIIGLLGKYALQSTTRHVAHTRKRTPSRRKDSGR